MKDLLLYMAKNLVDDPEAVTVTEIEDEDGKVLELRVAEGEMGKVIGRQGRIAKEIRTIIKTVAQRTGEKVTCSRRHPFSRSYGVNLPSSLTTLLPMALGSSPHLPVSVCGTGSSKYLTAFLATDLTHFASFGSLTPGATNARYSYIHVSLCLTFSVVTEFLPYVHRLRLAASP